MTDNMQRARELLAAECRAEKMGPVAATDTCKQSEGE